MLRTVPTTRKLTSAELDQVFSHPAVPPVNIVATAIVIPAAPKLGKITKTGTPGKLKALYSSAVPVFWPLHEYSKANVTDSVLVAAAVLLQQNDIAPAAYVQWAFRRATAGKAPRKSPVLAQVLFDPPNLEETLPGISVDPSIVATRIKGDEYLSDLGAVTRWLHREVRALSRYDPITIQTLADKVFPSGWRDEYTYAERYAAKAQSVIDERVATWQYVWGK